MTFEVVPVSREVFAATLNGATGKADAFAKTFLAKADMLDKWESAVGIFVDGRLAAAALWTFSKRSPVVCNFQLLHTFSEFRGKGLAKVLFDAAVAEANKKASYFRVSSERSALGFYQRIGVKFWGEQKSGCSLAMFKLNCSEPYDCSDRVIREAVFKKGKGGVVALSSLWVEPSQVDYFG